MKVINGFSYVLKKSSKAFIISLFVSLSIWMLINLSKTYEKTVSVKVVYTNNESSKIIKSKDSILKVKIQGTGFTFLKNSLDNLSYQISPENNVNQWFWDANDDKFKSLFPNSIEVLNVSPKIVNISTIKLSKRKVPIDYNITVIPKIGFAITESNFSKDSIFVFGPDKELNAVSTVKTDSLIVTDAHKDLIGTIKLNKPNKALSLEFMDTEYKYNIERFTQGSFTLDVGIKNIPEGKSIDVFPKQITLQFQSPLSSFDEFRKEQFGVFVDYNEVNASSSLPIYIDYVPDNVRNIKLLKNSVTYLLIEQ